MTESFNVSLEGYQGPFEVLLSLLSQRQLELTNISLSAITEEFLDYVRQLDLSKDADQVSSFIDVASILVEAKSASLIPHDASDDISDASFEALQERDLLFARLLQYRAFKQAGEDFRSRLAQNSGRFAHPAMLSPNMAALMPDIDLNISLEDFLQLAVHAFMNAPAQEVSVHQLHVPMVDLRIQAGIVRDILRAAGNKTEVSFTELVSGTTQKIEVVARFLAVLAFFKQGVVQFKQEQPFGQLFVRWLSDNDSRDTTDVVAISEGDFA
ncbi:segregation and condensation protein A [Alloscardovia criceti]|uniref:segregation and condensation protein A n=1 Tax=Alloscardovia criceti TaxID=356828 RepID=UPI000381B9B9|nr:segregation/condensation protein A [Alloscardovia criceti]